MADITTSWTVDLVNHITGPANEMMKSVDAVTEAVDSMTGAVNFNERETNQALTIAKAHYKDLKSQVNIATGEMLKLAKQAKASAGTSEQQEANQAYEEAKYKVERLRNALEGAKIDVDDLTEAQRQYREEATQTPDNGGIADNIASVTEEAAKLEGVNWGEIATGANQSAELIGKIAQGLDFTVEVANLTSEIQRMTDITGEGLDNIVGKTRRLAAIYDEDAKEIARAANAMTEQVGGSFEENLKLIEEGFKKGGNINGDFIDQMKEYPTFIKQLGLSQSEAIALIAQAGKKGIFSDKAIDSIKEGNLALREMGQTQIDALAGIKMKPEDLVDKTPFEAMKLITSKMKDMSPQARQMILTDLFKGAGEDAGLAFIEGLSDMDLDLTHLPSVEEAGAGIKGFFADVGTWAGQVFGDIGIYAQQVAPVFQIIAAGIPIIQAMTASQWSLNAAMDANPVGVIILAIAALIAIITVVVKKYDEWGAALALFLGPLGMVINLVMSFKRHWDSIVNAFKSDGIIGGLKRIGLVMLDALLMPIEQLLKLISKIPGMKKMAGGAAEWIKEQREKLNLTEGDKKPQEKTESDPSVNTDKGDKVDKLDKPTLPGKTGDGLNVGTGGGGIKSITMTLNIVNNFKADKGTDTRALADKIVGNVNDRLRDAVINLGE